jgi:hypothetical protein
MVWVYGSGFNWLPVPSPLGLIHSCDIEREGLIDIRDEAEGIHTYIHTYTHTYTHIHTYTYTHLTVPSPQY